MNHYFLQKLISYLGKHYLQTLLLFFNKNETLVSADVAFSLKETIILQQIILFILNAANILFFIGNLSFTEDDKMLVKNSLLNCRLFIYIILFC